MRRSAWYFLADSREVIIKLNIDKSQGEDVTVTSYSAKYYVIFHHRTSDYFYNEMIILTYLFIYQNYSLKNGFWVQE